MVAEKKSFQFATGHLRAKNKKIKISQSFCFRLIPLNQIIYSFQPYPCPSPVCQDATISSQTKQDKPQSTTMTRTLIFMVICCAIWQANGETLFTMNQPSCRLATCLLLFSNLWSKHVFNKRSLQRISKI